jgi:hypothetical protein
MASEGFSTFYMFTPTYNQSTREERKENTKERKKSPENYILLFYKYWLLDTNLGERVERDF